MAADQIVVESLFWASACGAVYSLAIYPALLCLIRPLARVRSESSGATEWPSISIVVAAYNEESRIAAKLENLLSLEYPEDKLEIVVVSDGSTDATESIVKSHGVRVLVQRGRDGKESAQLLGIRETKGDIIVFSDVATIMEPRVLHAVAEAFADTAIGAISSVDVLLGDDGLPVGEGAYVRYEMWLRHLESTINTLVGLSGSFFAVRRDVCAATWNIHIPSDFGCAISCATQGYRAVPVANVQGFYKNVADPRREYARKVRTMIRGMRGLWTVKEMLNPAKHGMFAFQLFSHKVMRWLVPWFMLAAFVLNLFLLDAGFIYRLTMAAQLALYGLASAGALIPYLLRFFIVRNAYYFVQVNLAAADAGLRFFRRESVLAWTPSER